MELTVEKTVLRMKEECKTDVQEHPLDCELVLPDVCPDIARVLKCRTEANVISQQITGDRLTAQGNVGVQLLYVDEDGEIRMDVRDLPFYHEFVLPDGAQAAAVTAQMAYSNWRMVNARKLELHAAVSLCAKPWGVRDVSLVTGAQGAGVQTLAKDIQATGWLAHNEKIITVNDEIQLETGNIRSVLYSTAVVRDAACKCVTDKTMIKGILAVSALYRDVDGSFEVFRADVPFSQIVETPGTDEHSVSSLRCEVTALELRPRTGLDGACKTVLVSAGVTVNVTAMQNQTLSLVEEAYSTEYNLCVRRGEYDLKLLTATVNEVVTHQAQLELGREIASVIDEWCDVSGVRTECTGDAVRVTGIIAVCVLALDSEQSPVVIDKTADFAWEYETETAVLSVTDVAASLQKTGFTLTGPAGMELHTELLMQANVFQTTGTGGITELTADTAAQPYRSPYPMAVYYARAGERLFDIACRYRTTVEAVQAANHTDVDLAAGGPLLIPCR